MLTEKQAQVFSNAQDAIKSAISEMSRKYSALDAEALENYLQRELRKYCAKFDPRKGDGEEFTSAVIRTKARMFVTRALKRG
ncbi:hypothetical protein EDC32_102250 [Laceyella sacchari]|jgi:hypothetical protein|nr:hypothetical protein EDC32_102250 [Laceyella sacchari]